MKAPFIFRIYKNNQILFVKQFTDKDQVVFGSSAMSGSEIDVDLESTEISAIHCLVEKRGSEFHICDLGSTQGTFKNGNQILDDVLASGDEFQIGPFKVSFFTGVPKPTHAQDSAEVVVVTPPPVVPPPPRIEKTTVVKAADAVGIVKPTITTQFVSQKPIQNLRSANKSPLQRRQRGERTFAPNSEYKNLNEFIKPSQGGVVEVIVSWKERILTTHHFQPTGQYKVGQDIQLPEGTLPKNWVLIDCLSGANSEVNINLNESMKTEVHRSENIITLSENRYKLQQGEVVFIQLSNGMQLAIRFAPKTALVPLDSPLILSSSEFTGILAALIFSVLLSLIVSVLSPKDSDKEDEVERVAQVIFNKPPIPVAPPPAAPPVEPPKAETPPPPKPPEVPKKIVAAEKKQDAQTKGDPKKPDVNAQKAQAAGRANEVKPKDSKLKTKMFTSTKQGGAIKTGSTAGANAKSKEPDPTNAGLLSAFGSGGARSKLDKAYSGSGELLGAADKATGSSGFNENRAGDDLGSKFKDTGAGGKGTATQGIAGIGTKGLGTGMSATGSGSGLGAKDQVAIQAGGAEEEFVGSIDREAVRRAVRSSYAAFKSCYEREYKKDTKLEGKVVIRWEIHERGVARNAQVVNSASTINNSAVENCVRDRMLTIRFPEPPAGTVAEIVYPFLFQGQK